MLFGLLVVVSSPLVHPTLFPRAALSQREERGEREAEGEEEEEEEEGSGVNGRAEKEEEEERSTARGEDTRASPVTRHAGTDPTPLQPTPKHNAASTAVTFCRT